VQTLLQFKVSVIKLYRPRDVGYICGLLVGPRSFFLLTPPMKMEQCAPKRRHVKFRRRVITQKKSHNIQNRAKV